MLPAVSVAVSLLPSSPIIISSGLVVDTPVTVGSPVAEETTVAGRLALGSNGLLVFAPDTPMTMTSPTWLLPRVPLNVTVTEVTVELATAYHSAIQA
jgi:hypothetical protein